MQNFSNLFHKVLAGHVAHIGEERGDIGFWWGNRRERDTGET